MSQQIAALVKEFEQKGYSSETFRGYFGSPDYHLYGGEGLYGAMNFAEGVLASEPQGLGDSNGDMMLASSIANIAKGIASRAVTSVAKGSAQSPLLQRYLAGSGGRWGGNAVRQLNHAEALKLEAKGYQVTGGAAGLRRNGSQGLEEA